MNLLLLGFGSPLLEGDVAGDEFGSALAGGADLDGDAAIDLVVGAPKTGTDDAGAVELYSAAGVLGTTLSGSVSSGFFGSALLVADVDGDGVAELIVGEPGYAGAAYVYADLALAATLTGEATDEEFGSALAAGDLDADGYDDLVVGSPGCDTGGRDSGCALAFSGGATGMVTTAAISWAGAAADDAFGTAVSVGDVDGDGAAEALIGAPGANTAYLFESGSAAASWSYVGTGLTEALGTAVALADLDGDGLEDAVTGATVGEDQTAVFLGTSAGLGAAADWSWESTAGWPGSPALLSSLGDVDSDGDEEVAYLRSSEGADCECEEPRAGILLGGTSLGDEVLTPIDANTLALAAAGDADGNGYVDLLVATADGVSVRLADADADADGFGSSVPTTFPDCDDADATVNPGGRELDYDSVDQDCDGELDRPTTTRTRTCPNFTTPAEAKPYADDPADVLDDPLGQLRDLADDLADDCGVEEDGEDGDCNEHEWLHAECDDGSIFSRSIEAAEPTYDEYESDCYLVYDGESLLVVDAEEASGVVEHTWRSSYSGDEGSDSSTYEARGVLAYADGTQERFVDERTTTGSTDIDLCEDYTRSYQTEVGACSFQYYQEYDACLGCETWTLGDGTHELVVTWLMCEFCEGYSDSDLAWAEFDGVGSLVYYADWTPVTDVEIDADGDGWPATRGDGDDTDPVFHPCATEVSADDAIDHDCDGDDELPEADTDRDDDGTRDDEDCAPDDPACYVCPEGYYLDEDADSYGGEVATGCWQSGWVKVGGDCDDSDPYVNARGTEACNAVDDDCDGLVDDDPVDGETFFVDGDADGFGAGSATRRCAAEPGESENNDDCDDTDPTVNPGATDIADDGVDQDCDGADAGVGADTGDKSDDGCGGGGGGGCGGRAAVLLLPLGTALRLRSGRAARLRSDVDPG